MPTCREGMKRLNLLTILNRRECRSFMKRVSASPDRSRASALTCIFSVVSPTLAVPGER